MKAMIAIAMEEAPMTISIKEIAMRAILREMSPQQTPLARGMQRQNLGS